MSLNVSLKKLYEDENYSTVIEQIIDLPKNLQSYQVVLVLAKSYIHLKDYQNGLSSLNTIAKKGTDDGDWNFYRGYLEFLQSNYDDALHYFKKGGRLGSKSAKGFAEILDDYFDRQKNPPPKEQPPKKRELLTIKRKDKLKEVLIQLHKYLPEIEPNIPVDKIESFIDTLLVQLNQSKISWPLGVELINDTLHLKKHDDTQLSMQCCKRILKWISNNYNTAPYTNLDKQWSSQKETYTKVLSWTDQLVNLIHSLSKQTDTTPLLTYIQQQSINEYEKNRITSLISYLNNPDSKRFSCDLSLSEKIKLLARVNDYFATQYQTNSSPYELVGLIETIQEHNLCYTMQWCQKSDIYLSPVKRGGWVGTGPMMISKTTEHMEQMGSSPGVDWIHLFELKIQNQEEYFSLEIPFTENYKAHLLKILELTEEQMNELINGDNILCLSETKSWCDSSPSFSSKIKELKKQHIPHELKIAIRLIDNEL